MASAHADAGAASLPAWIKALIVKHGARTNVEESRYAGKRVFVVRPGDRGFDAGNEFILYTADGVAMCAFGGFAPRMTSGLCDISKITYVRTLYASKRP